MWKDLVLAAVEIVLLALIIYDATQKPTKGLSFFLLSVLFIVVATHLLLHSSRLFYGLGGWFWCLY